MRGGRAVMGKRKNGSEGEQRWGSEGREVESEDGREKGANKRRGER